MNILVSLCCIYSIRIILNFLIRAILHLVHHKSFKTHHSTVNASMLFDAPAMPQQNGSKEAKERGSFGKIYTYKRSPRALGIQAVATSIGLELEQVELQPANGVPDYYWSLNPLGKTPTFVGADGLVLTECMAIALHVTNEDSTTTLLGSTSLDFVQIIRWISFTNTDVVNRMAAWVRPLIGYTPYSKEEVLKAQRETTQAIRVFEDNLRDRKYLVGDRLTLADIMCASLLSFGFAQIFDREWREDFPYFSGWYMMVMHLPIMKAVVDEVPFVEVGLPNAPPTEPFKAP